jgi:hypothetical protein
VAEEKVKQMQDITRGMLGQGFYLNIIGGGEVSAFLSQAKKTFPITKASAVRTASICHCSALAVAPLIPG